MERTLFITGTGTGVGKTLVTAALLRVLCQRGAGAVSMKPVQTGAVETPSGLRAPDLDVHRAAAGLSPAEGQDLELQAPYRYLPACSPHLAGRLAGVYPSIPHIVECAESLRARHGFLLIEGAGGLLVPLDETRTTLHLLQQLACPVLVVAPIGLGTINHSLLTLALLRVAGLHCPGIIFSESAPEPDPGIKQDNPATISRLGHVPVLGNVPYLPNFDPAVFGHWDSLLAHLPGIDSLFA